MSTLRNYESMLVLRPNLTKEETEALLEKFQAVIKEGQGETTKVDRMGKRRLAFEMKKLQEGFYCLIHFDAPAPLIAELERQFRLSEPVINFQIIRLIKPRDRYIKLRKPSAKGEDSVGSDDSMADEFETAPAGF